MAINSINGPAFNPYANGVGSARTSDVTPRAPLAPRTLTDRTSNDVPVPAASQKSVAEAIKSDASSRAAQVQSADAPQGVDQDLWSVLTKEERSFFVKAGAMGPLTYGRFSASQGSAPAPMLRGGRLDIKA